MAKDKKIDEEKTKVAIYVRVSTNKQELQNQIKDLTEYCNKKNYEIYRIYKDIITGKSLNRAAFTELFEDAHKMLFDVVLFWDLSRFSRSGTLYTLQKLKELENLTIDWESYQEPYFRSAGQFRDVVISIMATIAKMEKDKISERTKAGMRIKKLQGKHIGRPKGSQDKTPRLRLYWKKPKRGGADSL